MQRAADDYEHSAQVVVPYKQEVVGRSRSADDPFRSGLSAVLDRRRLRVVPAAFKGFVKGTWDASNASDEPPLLFDSGVVERW
jgi:hypothetical protein